MPRISLFVTHDGVSKAFYWTGVLGIFNWIALARDESLGFIMSYSQWSIAKPI